MLAENTESFGKAQKLWQCLEKKLTSGKMQNLLKSMVKFHGDLDQTPK